MRQSLTRNIANLAATCAIAFGALVASAQCEYTTLVQQVTASDPVSDAELGQSIAVAGTTYATGATGATGASGAEEAGAVYVFTRSGDFVTLQQKLVASDGATGDEFGFSVALLGNTLLVGARGDNGGRGAAYVFARSGTTWTQQAKLVASDGASNDRFGTSVSLTSSGERTIAVIGASGDDNLGPSGATGGTDAGAAYVFTLNTLLVGAQWTQVEKIMATDGGSGDLFGASLSARGTTAVIGAHRDTTLAGSAAGSAYVFVGNFTASTWTQQVRLVPNNGAANGFFGFGISYENNTALIGANGQAGGRGGFYVFTRSGTVWSQAHYFQGTSSRGDFGAYLALNGDLAVIGSLLDSAPRPPVKLYRRVDGAWTFLREIPFDVSQSGFGSRVAINGTTILVSAPYFTQSALNQGSIYIYDLETGPATQINSPPSDASVCPGEAAEFDVEAVGTQLTYQWQTISQSGSISTLNNGTTSVGTVSGATTPNLTFTTDQLREVRCQLTSACGVLNTDWVTLTVRAANDTVCTGEPVCPECAADYDQDGGVTGSDIGAFFTDFESGAACADVDLDGGITGADLGYFFQVFEAGGC